MRPELDRYFMDMARLVSSRSTCIRRAVGCVLVDNRNHVLATGYNGVPSSMPHCNCAIVHDGAIVFPNACDGANAASGTNIDACFAVHAEQNAVLQCNDAHAIAKAYVTTFPCASCAKLLLNTSCREIVFAESYSDDAGMRLWVQAGKQATRFRDEPPMIQRDLVMLYGEGESLNPWRVMVACVCLNLCSARTARSVVMRILSRWPDPDKLARAGTDLEQLLRPLGLSHRRAGYLRRLSHGYGKVPARELPGVDLYALESVSVFCDNQLPDRVGDRKIAAWIEWRKNVE